MQGLLSFLRKTVDLRLKVCTFVPDVKSGINMKFSWSAILFVAFPLLCVPQGIRAEKKAENLVDKINRAESGKGSVQVIQDASITERIGFSTKVDPDVVARFVEMSGYRIQVFVGNNQRASKNECYNKEAEIKSTFPDLSTYVVFTAPFWRLRVGDFQSQPEAQRILSKLRSTFPAYGREMSIVREKVRVKVR
jgi:hypothetical protein